MFKGMENVLDDNPKWNSFGLKTSEQLLLTIGYWCSFGVLNIEHDSC